MIDSIQTLQSFLRRPATFWPLFLVLLAAGSGLIWRAAVTDPQELLANPYPGFLAPDFELQTLDGEPVSLASLRGQVVVINLWASWCPPCRAEMPAMQAVYEGREEQPFEILAVNMSYQDDQAAAASFVAEHGLTFPILMDTTGEMASNYRLEALPTTFFVGPDGIIREIVPGGPLSEALIRSKIESILAEERS